MMKIFSPLFVASVLALTVACEKAPTEAEKNAQVEREVQQRLAAEHQTQEQQRLAQQQAELDARERALADKEASSSVATEPVAVAEATPRVVSRVSANSSANEDQDAPRSYDTFYRKLEPYGAWRETGDYGYVWQPREAQSRDWRPYTDGRWAYTDAGWTWVSDEPFGWATYHYGRWTRLRDVGWVWVPGEEWAPAWVSWRKGDQNVGWAPLPPEARFDRNKGIHKWADNYYDIDAGEYVFIPNEEIGAENVRRAVIPSERNVTIVNETTNVTNITYSNTTIVNEGPNYDELRSHSRRPLQRMRLEREFNVERNESPRASAHGDVLQMVTPLFTARATQRPRTSAPAIKQVTVERAIVSDQPDAQRARAKMRSENAPPSDAPSKRFEKPAVAEGTAAPVAATAAPTSTPIAAATATPVAAPSATPIPAATAIATPTPRASIPTRPVVHPSATESPAVLATPRPTFAPRATPAPTAVAPIATPAAAAVEPLATPVPIHTPRPRVLPTAVPIPPAPTVATPPPTAVVPGDVAEPKSVPPNGGADRAAAARAEQQRRRQEAVQKMLPPTGQQRATPAPAQPPATPPVAVAPTPPPRQMPVPRATPPARAADQVEGTPAGIEMQAPPRGDAKRRGRPLPPGAATPTPAADGTAPIQP